MTLRSGGKKRAAAQPLFWDDDRLFRFVGHGMQPDEMGFVREASGCSWAAFRSDGVFLHLAHTRLGAMRKLRRSFWDTSVGGER